MKRRPTTTASLPLIVALVGGGGIAGQVILLRGFVIAGGGNELTMGIVLANWLVCEAIGAYVGDRIVSGRKNPGTVYALLMTAFAAILPLASMASGSAPSWMTGAAPGEGIGMTALILSSLVVLGPVSAIHGATFPTACRIFSLHGLGQGIGRAYLYETLGSLVGGIVLTLAFIARWPSMHVVLWLTIIHFFAAIYVVASPRMGALSQPTPAIIASLAVVLLLIPMVPTLSRLGNVTALRWKWGDGEVVESRDTPHGRITVMRRLTENTVYYNGEPLLTVPNPDLTTAVDFAHLAAASHEDPSRVLLIAGGFGGLAQALLRHPIDELVYVDLDPDLPEILRTFDCAVLQEEFSDPRLRLEHRDARLFLRDDPGSFDLIVLGFIDPTTLQANRLFTREFFHTARARLNPGGLFAVSLAGSPTGMTPELADLNASIFRAAAPVFPRLQIIPGDRNIYLMSAQSGSMDADILAARLETRLKAPGFLSHAYLEHRLDAQRAAAMRASLEASRATANEDLNPRGVYYGLSHWGGIFSPGLSGFLQRVSRLHPAWLVFLPGLMALVLMACGGSPRARRQRTVTYSIWTSGISGMAFDLLILFVFQILYGFVYSMLGALIAAFTVGLYLGGRLAIGVTDRERALRFFRYLEIFIASLLPSLYLVTVLLQVNLHRLGILPIFLALMTFAAVSGGGVGAQFPLAAHIVDRSTSKTTPAGSLYAADLLGGWFGGLLIAIVAFPLWGLLTTTLLLASLKISSLALLVGTERRDSGSWNSLT